MSRVPVPQQRQSEEVARQAERPRPPLSAAGGDIVPLSRRAAAMAVVRCSLAVVVVVTMIVADADVDAGAFALALAGYLAVTGALSALVLCRSRLVGLWGFGLAMAVDGMAAQYLHYRFGEAFGADAVIIVLLVAICLLASSRTGLRAAVWQSVMFVVVDRGLSNGFIPAPPGGPGAGPQAADSVGQDLVIMWLAVLLTAFASTTSERELRRRRYDAEALQSFAARLHEDETAEHVLRRVMRFTREELNGRRVLACAWVGGEFTVLQSDGLGGDQRSLRAAGGSEFLAGCAADGRPALALAVGRTRDPWLSAVLPDARRLVALRIEGLPTGEPSEMTTAWVVFEHGQRGDRVERRVLATAGQASATAGLAMSRALLLQQARRAATTDGLTGVANRRVFDLRVTEALAREQVSALVLVDVDHFKRVNDEHGHLVGDEVLKHVAAALANACEGDQLVARYGGEEFAVLLPGASAGTAAALAERLRLALARSGGPVPVTASFGVADSGGGTTDPTSLIAAADAALYRAKQAGRNRVESAERV